MNEKPSVFQSFDDSAQTRATYLITELTPASATLLDEDLFKDQDPLVHDSIESVLSVLRSRAGELEAVASDVVTCAQANRSLHRVSNWYWTLEIESGASGDPFLSARIALCSPDEYRGRLLIGMTVVRVQDSRYLVFGPVDKDDLDEIKGGLLDILKGTVTDRVRNRWRRRRE